MRRLHLWKDCIRPERKAPGPRQRSTDAGGPSLPLIAFFRMLLGNPRGQRERAFFDLAVRLPNCWHLPLVGNLHGRNSRMSDSILNLYTRGQTLICKLVKDEQGQDLVEYAAVIVIVVLGLTAGMHTLANAINNAMTNVGTYISSVIG
jgi:pilus assembly protein Flp/PilA